MEKSTMGSIYGSRISKNGKWLNLTIVAKFGEEKRFINVPVRLADSLTQGREGDKPFCKPIEERNGRYFASLEQIPFYPEENKEQKEITEDEVPF